MLRSKEKLLMIVRFLKHIGIELVVSWPLTIIGVVLLLPVCYIQNKRGVKQLPTVLKWFDCADWYVNRNTSSITKVIEGGWFNWYYYISIRNPLNYFSYVILGVKIESIESKLVQNRFYSDNVKRPLEVGDTKNAGFQVGEYIINGKTYYEYYLVQTYEIFGKIKCLRVRFGHKLGFNPEIGNYYEYVTVLSPYHTYTGSK